MSWIIFIKENKILFGGFTMVEDYLVVVDDNSDISELVVDCVCDELVLVGKIAYDSYSGFDLYKKFKPNVLITDYDMGSTKGSDLVKMIREYERTNNGFNSYIIGMSSSSDYIKMLEKAGANKLLKKPFDVYELLDVVKPFYNKI
jgi:DNA-binding response OmpR family regulator